METGQVDLTRERRVVHMQNIDRLGRTYCGRPVYRQKHVTTRFMDCTCQVCWLAIAAKVKGMKPGHDFVITRLG